MEDTVLVILAFPLHKDIEYFEISHGKSIVQTPQLKYSHQD